MAFNVFYRAYDTSAKEPKTGDAANHTVSVEVDGTNVTGLTETEVGSGVYRVSLSDAQLPEGSQFVAHGTSSTADVNIFSEPGVRPETMRGTDNASTHSSPDVSNLDVPISSRSTFDHTTDEVNVGSINGDPVENVLLTDGDVTGAVWSDSNKAPGANLDESVSSRSSHTAADVWSVTTRTLTSFGSLVSDIVSGVWSATTRTLTAFGFTVTTDPASRTASQADVSGLSTFDHTNDEVSVGEINGDPVENVLLTDNDVTDSVWSDNTKAPGANIDVSLSNILAAVQAIDNTSTGFGLGPDIVPLTFVDNNGVGIPGGKVWITNDAAGDQVVVGPITTDSTGTVKLLLEDGKQYYRWFERVGYNPVVGLPFTAQSSS